MYLHPIRVGPGRADARDSGPRVLGRRLRQQGSRPEARTRCR